MVTSTQITASINNAVDPNKKKHQLWQQTRYLVAQKPADPSNNTTMPGFYLGRVVIPGPKANPKLSEVLNDYDLDILENKHFIRFVDNATTDNASPDIAQGLYTIMTKDEANDYEAKLSKYYESQESTGVSSKTTE